jgi:hypothetical protein
VGCVVAAAAKKRNPGRLPLRKTVGCGGKYKNIYLFLFFFLQRPLQLKCVPSHSHTSLPASEHQHLRALLQDPPHQAAASSITPSSSKTHHTKQQQHHHLAIRIPAPPPLTMADATIRREREELAFTDTPKPEKKRGRGRPRGSKNRSRAEIDADRAVREAVRRSPTRRTAQNNSGAANRPPSHTYIATPPPALRRVPVSNLKSTKQWVRGCIERLHSNTNLGRVLTEHRFLHGIGLEQQYQYAVVDVSTNNRATCLTNMMCSDTRRKEDAALKQRMQAPVAQAPEFEMDLEGLINDFNINNPHLCLPDGAVAQV